MDATSAENIQFDVIELDVARGLVAPVVPIDEAPRLSVELADYADLLRQHSELLVGTRNIRAARNGLMMERRSEDMRQLSRQVFDVYFEDTEDTHGL